MGIKIDPKDDWTIFTESVDGEEVQWEWKDKNKQFYETWRPKAKDIKVLSNVSDALVQRTKDQIMLDIEVENEKVRSKINENARNRRAKLKQDNRT